MRRAAVRAKPYNPKLPPATIGKKRTVEHVAAAERDACATAERQTAAAEAAFEAAVCANERAFQQLMAPSLSDAVFARARAKHDAVAECHNKAGELWIAAARCSDAAREAAQMAAEAVATAGETATSSSRCTQAHSPPSAVLRLRRLVGIAWLVSHVGML